MAPAAAERCVGVLISTRRFTTWIPGTSPGMTRMASGKRPILAPMREGGDDQVLNPINRGGSLMRGWLTAIAFRAARKPMPALLSISAFGWLLMLAPSPSDGWPSAICGAPFADPSALVLQWIAMLIAMTPPLLDGPIQRLWKGSLARRRVGAIACFVVGYALVWIFAGAALGGAVSALEWVFGRWAFAVALALALGWRLAPGQEFAHARAHAAPRLRVFGAVAFADGALYGLQYGLWCIFACWPLMLAALLAPIGRGPAMFAAAVLMIAERYAPRAEPIYAQ
jgi:predicted metal-binding membrane protein